MSIEITRTSSASEAARLLSASDRAYLLGGGTGLMRRIHEGDTRVRQLIVLTDHALTGIERVGSRLRIGAQVTMAQILAAPEARVLHKAAASVGAPALRNMATVGGNLFARPPYGDLTVALLALGAELEFATGTGVAQRELKDALGDRTRRVVTGVLLSNPNSDILFSKMSRSHPRGASVVTLGVTMEKSGSRINAARVAVGGLAGAPCRAAGAERALSGKSLDIGVISAAAAALTDGIMPFSDALASGWYREKMAAVQFRRLLEESI